jgi:hypothetical protein
MTSVIAISHPEFNIHLPPRARATIWWPKHIPVTVVFSKVNGFNALVRTDDLNVWPIRSNIRHPRYESIYPLNVLVCRRS